MPGSVEIAQLEYSSAVGFGTQGQTDAAVARLKREAASLGANGFQRFLRVYLPLSMPGVLAGAAMVFLLAVGMYTAPALVRNGRMDLLATNHWSPLLVAVLMAVRHRAPGAGRPASTAGA